MACRVIRTDPRPWRRLACAREHLQRSSVTEIQIALPLLRSRWIFWSSSGRDDRRSASRRSPVRLGQLDLPRNIQAAKSDDRDDFQEAHRASPVSGSLSRAFRLPRVLARGAHQLTRRRPHRSSRQRKRSACFSICRGAGLFSADHLIRSARLSVPNCRVAGSSVRQVSTSARQGGGRR
jgi:hypothetical protein